MISAASQKEKFLIIGICKRIESGVHRHVLLDFAVPDMEGCVCQPTVYIRRSFVWDSED